MQSISKDRRSSFNKTYLQLPYKESLFNSYKNYPKSRLLFVTIRDAKDRYTMNKAINWIKKYCDTLCIVRGLKGGTHYHLLAGLIDTTWVPHGSKGVHFNLSYVDQDKSMRLVPSDADIQDILYSKHIAKCRRESLIERLDVPAHCVRQSNAILTYFDRKLSKAKRIATKNRKESHILRILEYLEQNLNENDSIVRYITSYEKYPSIRHIPDLNE